MIPNEVGSQIQSFGVVVWVRNSPRNNPGGSPVFSEPANSLQEPPCGHALSLEGVKSLLTASSERARNKSRACAKSSDWDPWSEPCAWCALTRWLRPCPNLKQQLLSLVKKSAIAHGAPAQPRSSIDNPKLSHILVQGSPRPDLDTANYFAAATSLNHYYRQCKPTWNVISADTMDAIILLAGRIMSECQYYITTVKDAPVDLRTIMIEVGSVKCILEVLKIVTQGVDGDVWAIREKLKSPDGPLAGCRAPHRGEAQKILKSLETLAWPFKATQARKFLDDIGRHKATISLALATTTAHDIKNVKSNVKYLRDTLDDEKREKILKWLVTTDPSSNHNKACELHEPHTGKWLVTSPEYKSWKSASNRFLWLHGIPGAGKTVLASFILEDVKEFCKNSSPGGTAWAYYYCYFRREQDESSHLLRWVINQLCRQTKQTPNELLELYHDGGQPSIASLTAVLSALLLHFRRLYIVIDALDESDRQNLLNMLTRLAGEDGFEKIRLLTTSRKELDIERALENISISISLSNTRVDEDIRVYIHSQLHDDSRFSHWPGLLKAEIKAALVKGAKGMFRWAFCQLDILRRLKTEPAIRQALGQLPKTLDETYERILESIPAENHVIAHRAFQWLAFGTDCMSLEALADAVVVNDEQCSFSPDGRLLSPKDLLEICSCLITVSGDLEDDEDFHEVGLAHYTVKEFLISDRIKVGPAAYLYTSPVSANILAARSSITYLLNIDYEKLNDADGVVKPRKSRHIFPFLYYAIMGWYDWAQKVEREGGDATVTGLVLKRLNPCGPHFKRFLEQVQVQYDCAMEVPVPEWTCPPGAEPTVVLAYTCHFDLLGAAEALLARNPNPPILGNRLRLSNWDENFPLDAEGTPLQVAIALQKKRFISFLIDKGADANTPVGSASTIFVYFLEQFGSETADYQRNVANLMFAAGANANPSGLAMTPLQAAVRLGNIATVQSLLEAGADVNAVGSDEAVVARIRHLYRDDEGNRYEAAINDDINTRGEGTHYDTPLRIVENSRVYGSEVKVDLVNLLQTYGAKSLHLFPVKDLPGYVEADMKAMTSEDSQDAVEVPMESDVHEQASLDIAQDLQNAGVFENSTYTTLERAHGGLNLADQNGALQKQIQDACWGSIQYDGTVRPSDIFRGEMISFFHHQ